MVRISEKHGVNPAVPVCFFCGREKNEVVLFGRLPNDVEAPRHPVIDKTPCVECIEYMKKGIICISVRDGEYGDNPYRTGGFAVVKETAIIKLFKDVEQILFSRVCFIPDKVWDVCGFPRD